MDFNTAAKLGTYISKDYAEDLFRLLINYQDISASEAASRLGLHIKTAQEFMETMTSLNILEKVEVYEKKRPYFRYSLKQKRITMDIDLTSLVHKQSLEGDLNRRIKERKNAKVRFAAARDNRSISSVTIWIGEGRQRKERKINLTPSQGKFLFHLPFPTAEYLNILEIMEKAQVEKAFTNEILDIADLLKKYHIIEEA
jgi:transposase